MPPLPESDAEMTCAAQGRCASKPAASTWGRFLRVIPPMAKAGSRISAARECKQLDARKIARNASCRKENVGAHADVVSPRRALPVGPAQSNGWKTPISGLGADDCPGVPSPTNSSWPTWDARRPEPTTAMSGRSLDNHEGASATRPLPQVPGTLDQSPDRPGRFVRAIGITWTPAATSPRATLSNSSSEGPAVQQHVTIWLCQVDRDWIG